ncbi:hypothetical protein V7O62_05010 [Methanolobus sp. ZRKC2]|uniref:hypothetical protein n=1 Tax=Methanolobus sp. ZRKC2 TaxID=3125783 RepID=UPI00324857DD
MAGKYLTQNCLCVENSTAVATVQSLLKEDWPEYSYKSGLNKSSTERSAFLKKVKSNKK